MISVTEILLIIAGFVAVVLGFVLPAGRGDAVDPEVVEDLVQDKLDRSLNDSVRRQIDGMARDAVADAIDDTRLELSRESNSKVMEISEYAGTVLEDIKKNHDEVVFMYDMLKDKHSNMLQTVSEMTKTAENAKQTVRDAELTARDAKDAVATLDAATARVKRAKAMEQQAVRTAIAAQEVADATAGITPAKAEPVAATMQTPPAGDAPEMKNVAWAPITGGTADGATRTVVRPQASAIAKAEMAVSAQEEAEPMQETEPQTAAPAANTPNTARTAVRRGTGEPMSQNRQILEMHEAGKSNMVIARELGLGIGEVRLVIDLAKKQRGIKEN